MPRVKPLGNKDMQAIAMAKRAASSLSEEEATLIRQLNALKQLSGKGNDAAFADLIGISEGRYRYLKRFPGQFKLCEIRLVQELAKQYNLEISFLGGVTA